MKRSVVAALVAVVLALGGSLAVLAYVNRADQRALAGKEAVKVVVAAKKIPAGTTGARIRSEKLAEVVAMPRNSVPTDAMSELDSSLDELVVTFDVQPRQLLLRGAFGELSTSSGIALPEGKLAVSFPVTCVSAIRLGSQIAIFNTFNSVDGAQHVPNGKLLDNSDAGALHVTRLVLPRVKVILVTASDNGTPAGGNSPGLGNGNAAAAPSDGQDAAASASCDGSSDAMVTVGVTQPEAEKLIHAMQTGTLAFAIVDDKSDVKPGEGVDSTQLFS